MPTSSKILIGRSDIIDLPELKLFEIHAKVDTGAYTSALHADGIKVVNYWGTEYLVFNLLHPSRPELDQRELKAKEFTQRNVKSSNGQIEERYVIETDVVIFGETIRAEFSLTDRGEMRYPILLGRKLLQGKFIVDVARTNLSFLKRRR